MLVKIKIVGLCIGLTFVVSELQAKSNYAKHGPLYEGNGLCTGVLGQCLFGKFFQVEKKEQDAKVGHAAQEHQGETRTPR